MRGTGKRNASPCEPRKNLRAHAPLFDELLPKGEGLVRHALEIARVHFCRALARHLQTAMCVSARWGCTGVCGAIALWCGGRRRRRGASPTAGSGEEESEERHALQARRATRLPAFSQVKVATIDRSTPRSTPRLSKLQARRTLSLAEHVEPLPARLGSSGTSHTSLTQKLDARVIKYFHRKDSDFPFLFSH